MSSHVASPATTRARAGVGAIIVFNKTDLPEAAAALERLALHESLGYAVVPGVFGLVHDATGGYGAVLALAIALQGTGALVLLARAGTR